MRLLGGIPGHSLQALQALGYPLEQRQTSTAWGRMAVLEGPPTLLQVIDEVRFNVCADLVDHVRARFPPARARLRVL
ncbi:MAG: hypothetical protein IRZ16_09475 [Myxococcaceae bacterium]|nr:hypothetical protein [Myxococcaceae bacterium]